MCLFHSHSLTSAHKFSGSCNICDNISLTNNGLCACAVLCFEIFSVLIFNTGWIIQQRVDIIHINKVLWDPPKFLSVKFWEQCVKQTQIDTRSCLGILQLICRKAEQNSSSCLDCCVITESPAQTHPQDSKLMTGRIQVQGLWIFPPPLPQHQSRSSTNKH